MDNPETSQNNQQYNFKAETRQLLDILIHSLYTEREVFLRELISNASDALTRMNFEILTNREIVDPQAELGIWITTDPEARTLTIRDTGIGMNAQELAENLGTIAHSGARAFLSAASENKQSANDIIGQFGVGFYSAFMVAESIKVTSRSSRPDDQPAAWISTGSDTFQIETAEKIDRGSVVEIKLKEESAEFTGEKRLREIIKKHSDFVPYPIYLQGSTEQVNQQNALWRVSPRELTEEKAHEFYRQFTMEFEPPIAYAHMAIDAPVQMYALLFIPASSEKGFFSQRKEDGLKLYARKILIQDYCTDLLPPYLRFIQGVVDTEDLPLNVSRETIQSTRLMGQLKRLVTNKIIDTLKDLAVKNPDDFAKFWKAFNRFFKEGIAIDPESRETIAPILRFNTLQQPESLSSLDDLILRMKPEQKKLYYILGDDSHSILRSPHLDLFRHHAWDVLLLTDPIDSFMILSLNKYKEFDLVNASAEKPEEFPQETTPPEEKESPISNDTLTHLVSQFKDVLGSKVADVRTTTQLLESPARLVDTEGSPNQEVQRVYRMLKQDYQVPQKILEINPSHPLIRELSAVDSASSLASAMIEQIYENTLLIEGLHPDPAGMISRIQEIMQAAMQNKKES